MLALKPIEATFGTVFNNVHLLIENTIQKIPENRKLSPFVMPGRIADSGSNPGWQGACDSLWGLKLSGQ